MSTVESILDLLNKWPAWKRITQTPERVDALERRVIALEATLARAPGDACPKCGALALRVTTGERAAPGALGLAGVRLRNYTCEACSFRTERQITP